ncbi:Nucleolar protein 12, partial [Spiromyces aspiralis]
TPKTTKPEAKPDDPEKTERTVFIGNLTTEAITNKSVYKAVKKMFSKYGEIESIRFRSVAFSKLLSRKAAFISKQIHKDRSTCNAYIVFKDKETAQKACELNGTVLHEKHIRVDLASSSGKSDPKRTVFIGSVAFDEEEENVWNHFSTCGIVENVRLVRDPKTNLGKGFGYVQFRDVASVGLALKLDQTKLGERKIRVSRCTRTTKKSAPEGGAAKKKRRTNKDEPVAVEGARAAKGDRIGKTKKLRNGEAAKKRLARKTKKQKQK